MGSKARSRITRVSVLVVVVASLCAAPGARGLLPGTIGGLLDGLLDRDGHVRADGRQLTLHGRPYRFAGLNIYNANSDGTCGFAYTPDAFRQTLREIGRGQNAIRAWFFQNLTTAQGSATRDWSRFDRTLDVAGRMGVKVIVTLGNQWWHCEKWPTEEAGYKTRAWYETGYKTNPGSPGMPSTYRQWVAEVVARYRSNPNVLMWQLVNEAEAAEVHEGTCLEDPAFAAMKGFATDMAGVVKAIDRNHLLGLGTLGSGQCGTSWFRYKELHSVPGIDVCEVHDYTLTAIPDEADAFNGFPVRARQCAELNKPLFVGEAGIRANMVGGTLQARADRFRDKFGAQVRAGSVGQMMWAWSDDEPPASSLTDYDIGPGDPALANLSRVSRAPYW